MVFISILNQFNCPIIFLFSPFGYDSMAPHPLKELWDTAPWFKYQMSAGSLEHYLKAKKNKDYFAGNQFQNEIEGNWVGV